MTNLISGKEALIALANGEEVEYSHEEEPYGRWTTISKFEEYSLDCFLAKNTKFKFRIKPRTIKLSVDIPAPFEPKDGEKAYRLAPAVPCGYTEFYLDKNDNEWQFGAWRTESEIKQVVAALRQVFGLPDDAVNAVRGGK